MKSKILALTGKGGVGKTSLSAIIVKILSENYKDKKILAIDADPAIGLATALGVDVKITLDDIRTEIINTVEGGDTKTALELVGESRYKIAEAIVEKDNFAFLAIGRPETKGCYCRINSYLKSVIETVGNQFDYIVIDCEAGIEQVNRRVIEENARKLNIPIHIFESNIFDYVYTVDKSPCYLCARMRRGHLYDYARRLGCNKIALGHHYDDVIETILMGMLYGAQVQTMMPKLHSTNFPGMELIRQLYLIREDDIKAWRDANELHFIQCACHFTDTCTTCSNQETRSKRQEIKDLIRTLKQRNPDVEAHIFRSVENVNLDTVIGWKTGGKKYSFLDRYDEEA